MSIMRRDLSLSQQKSQSGFALVSAIFLLVILAALGVFMLSLSTTQQTTSTQDLQGSRAYQAAKTGIEWAAYQILTPENNNPAAGGVAQYVCAPASLPVLPSALAGVSVNITCASNAYTEGGKLITVYNITSTASFGNAPNVTYVERSINASINTCRLSANGPPC